MLHRITSQFLNYCRFTEFSVRSIQTLTARINEFEAFINFLKIRSIQKNHIPAPDRFCFAWLIRT